VTMKCSYPICCSLLACSLLFGCTDTVVGRPLLTDVDARDESSPDLGNDDTITDADENVADTVGDAIDDELDIHTPQDIVAQDVPPDGGDSVLDLSDVPPDDGNTVLDLNDLELGCAPGQLLCGEECVDPAIDSRNCGGCGQDCRSSWDCQGGFCWWDCGGTSPTGCTDTEKPWLHICTDLQYDRDHCGNCGTRCELSEVCNNYNCECYACDACTCKQGSTCCPGSPNRCADLSTDRWNCGACGNVCAGWSCIDGQCQ